MIAEPKQATFDGAHMSWRVYYLLPNLLRDLHDVIFPADDDLYSRLACRYPMQKEEIFQAHNYLHVNGLLDNSGQ